MKKEDLSLMSLEKMQAELKGVKMITGALIGVLSVLFVVVIYGLLTNDEKGTFIALLTVAIACSAIIPVNYVRIKEINSEIKSRGSKESL